MCEVIVVDGKAMSGKGFRKVIWRANEEVVSSYFTNEFRRFALVALIFPVRIL